MSRRPRRFVPAAPGPYLKWAGSKAFLADPKLVHHVPIPGPGGRWREPFCGSGGLYLSLEWPSIRLPAVLTDINPRIVGVHQAVRDHVDGVILRLTQIASDRAEAEHAGEEAVAKHYYHLRDAFNDSALDPASALGGALFIATNKLCMNGLYRESQDGTFNVSVGAYKNPGIFDPEHLRACSLALAGVDLRVVDCEVAMDEAEPGDGMLLDLPYAPVSKTASFTAYSHGGGDWNASTSQLAFPGVGGPKRQRVANKLHELDQRGVSFLLTDADTEETRALYSAWRMDTVSVPRSISRDGKGRQAVNELLVTNKRNSIQS
jgi:DNA adenine methylase